MSAEDMVRLHTHSGVPVVDVLGEWDDPVREALEKVIFALTEAGHFEIVLNIQRAVLDVQIALRSLSRLARLVRAHFGHLDLLATDEQIAGLTHAMAGEMMRMTHSEEVAIGRIKGIPVLASGPCLTARPVWEAFSSGRPEATRRADIRMIRCNATKILA